MFSLSDLKFGVLHGEKRVNISCALTEFPVELFELADSLEILDLSGNQLSSLPDDFSRFTQLRILFYLITILRFSLLFCRIVRN